VGANARTARDAMTESSDMLDMIEAALAKDAIDNALAADPIDPMEATEPTDPMLSTELRLPMHRMEFVEPMLQRDDVLIWLPLEGADFDASFVSGSSFGRQSVVDIVTVGVDQDHRPSRDERYRQVEQVPVVIIGKHRDASPGRHRPSPTNLLGPVHRFGRREAGHQRPVIDRDLVGDEVIGMDARSRGSLNDARGNWAAIGQSERG